MSDTTMLEKVDIIRSRYPVSYKEASDLLEQNGGNVVQALIELEDKDKHPGMAQQVEERITVMGSELKQKLQELLRTGQHANIRVLRGGKQVMSIPAAVGAVSALVLPTFTVFATVAAITQKYEIVLDKRGQKQQQQGQQSNTCAKDAGFINVHHEEVEQAPSCKA